MSQIDSGSDTDASLIPGVFGDTADRAQKSTSALGISATAFARAMTKAFSDATTGGKQFDDVLKQLALRLSNLAVTRAFQPIAKNVSSGLDSLFGEILGNDSNAGKNKGGAIDTGMMSIAGLTPFAAGGVIGAPAYFPLASGGVGLAGEAGPEAILPLSRGDDGRLGIAMNGARQVPNVTVQIATPDPGSFRRSESYITGQIARAVARGQRGF
ncbi:MAG TPA: phage tail tape measure protein [Pseudolabrys sp.]|nr:phage tail tape measure protein [Pseudolabrys sp.]